MASPARESEYQDEDRHVEGAHEGLGGIAKGHDAVGVSEIVGEEALRN